MSKIHFPDPPVKPKNLDTELKPQNEIKGHWVQQKCADKDCEQLLGHWSKDGSWHYPGAKCEKHSKGAKN